MEFRSLCLPYTADKSHTLVAGHSLDRCSLIVSRHFLPASSLSRNRFTSLYSSSTLSAWDTLPTPFRTQTDSGRLTSYLIARNER